MRLGRCGNRHAADLGIVEHLVGLARELRLRMRRRERRETGGFRVADPLQRFESGEVADEVLAPVAGTDTADFHGVLLTG